MRALSIKQPWAWLVIHGGKDVENRSRPTKIREKIAIHTSLKDWPHWDTEEFPKGCPKLPDPDSEEWQRGAIIGFVELTDCVETHRSKWFKHGSYGYVFKNPVSLMKPVPCKGNRGFWKVPDDVLKRCKVAK